MMEKKTVATHHPAYDKMAEHWPIVRTLADGTHAMRKAGKQFLPKESAESETAYTIRLSRTVLFNAFGKTIDDMVGRIFRNEITYGDDVPGQIQTWAENVDMTGQHLNVFASNVAKDAMTTGLAHILVDTPRDMEGATRATQGRPYFVHLKAEAVIGWTARTGGNGLKLETLRFKETVTEPDGEYHVQQVEQIKVLKPFAWEVWRKVDQSKEWELYETGTRDEEGIPLATVYFGRTGFMTAEPPLIDLADLNVAHWQSSSDQRNILHVARVPILFGAGFDDGAEIVIGASVMTRAADPAAKLSYVEHTGNAITSGRDDLKDLEFQMQAMGLQLLVDKPGQSATGEMRDSVKETSQLAMWADALRDGLENALVWMARLGGVGPDGGSLIVNKDFGIAPNQAVDIQAVIAAKEAGLISATTALREFIRRGFVSDDIDPETELEEAANDAVSMMQDQVVQDALPPNRA